MTILDEFRRDETRVLDRLVDGELGQRQRHELLAAFDDEPGAWRRCALAFLEAQAWRHELAWVAAEPLLAQSRDALAVAPAVSRRRWLGAWLALAASLAVGFGLGTRFDVSSGRQELAQSPGAETQAGGPHDSVQQAASDDTDDEGDRVPLEYVTLRPADGDDDAREIELPVINNAEGEQWAAEQSAAANHFVEELSNAGLEVTRKQRLWPVDLSDGRRLIVPVEELDVRDPELRQL